MRCARPCRWPVLATLLVAVSLASTSACERMAAPAPERTLEQLLPGAFETVHYGYFMADKRVGWRRTALQRVEPGGEYEVERTSHFDWLMGGQPMSSQHREFFRYAAETPHRLLFAESTAVEDGATTVRTLSDGEHGLELRTQSGGDESRFAVGSSTSNLRETFDAMRRVLDGRPDDVAAYSEFEFDRGRDTTVTMRNAGRSTERVDGADVELTRVDESSDGSDGGNRLFVASGGRIEIIRVGNTVEVRRMDEAAATAPAEALDALDTFSVPLEGFEGPAWNVAHLELEWSGSETLLPERDFQHARWEREHELLQIVALEGVQPPSAAERALSIPEAVAAELAPDPLCESDHPRVLQAALEAIAGRDDPWDRTVAIVRWVYANVASSLTSNRTTALAVLEARSGDCSEHTLLACALLRASGVPARRVGGVARVGPSEPLLGSHAWIEVWIGRWIPIDPTWNQAPADATHVCFGGERDSRIDDSGPMRARVRKIERR